MRVRWLLVPLISSYWMRDLIQKCIVVTLRRKSGPSVVRSSSPSPPFPAFIGVTNRVVGDNPIVPVLLRRPTPLWVAVPADPSRVAVRLVSVFPAQSLVVEARVFSNCIPHCPVVGSVAVPSVAPVVYQVAARIAGQNGLSKITTFGQVAFLPILMRSETAEVAAWAQRTRSTWGCAGS